MAFGQLKQSFGVTAQPEMDFEIVNSILRRSAPLRGAPKVRWVLLGLLLDDVTDHHRDEGITVGAGPKKSLEVSDLVLRLFAGSQGAGKGSGILVCCHRQQKKKREFWTVAAVGEAEDR